MHPNNTFRTVALVGLSFAAYYFLFENFKFIKTGLDTVTHQGLLSYILTYLITGIPIFFGTYLIDRETNIVKSLGLAANIPLAAGLSILFTLPMFAGGWLSFSFNLQINPQQLIAGTIVAGFMEELYFRGFLFGQLFRNTNLGFLPSIFFGALIFASGHLYQSRDIGELSGIFAITFAGAVFFAWLYVEWNYNLWVPIFTHTLMNLAWYLFEVNHTALGDIKANVFRALTIIVAITGTILYKKKKNKKLAISRQTLIMQKKINP